MCLRKAFHPFLEILTLPIKQFDKQIWLSHNNRNEDSS